MDYIELMMVSPLRSGMSEIKVIGRSPDSELVVHRRVKYPGEDEATDWVVSHRRTGLAISHAFPRGPMNLTTQPSMDRALELADALAPLFDWSKIAREPETEKIVGLPADEMKKGKERVREAINKFNEKFSDPTYQ
jgi:hypothetical protein